MTKDKKVENKSLFSRLTALKMLLQVFGNTKWEQGYCLEQVFVCSVFFLPFPVSCQLLPVAGTINHNPACRIISNSFIFFSICQIITALKYSLAFIKMAKVLGNKCQLSEKHIGVSL